MGNVVHYFLDHIQALSELQNEFLLHFTYLLHLFSSLPSQRFISCLYCVDITL